MTRVIARRFNDRYGQVFPEPPALLTSSPEVPELDGRKTSKSYGNAITLSMTADDTAAAIRKAPTDSQRRITFDPINRPGVSALLTTAALCSGRDENDLADQIGDAGAGALKKLTTTLGNDFLAPHRQRRNDLAQDPPPCRRRPAHRKPARERNRPTDPRGSPNRNGHHLLIDSYP